MRLQKGRTHKRDGPSHRIFNPKGTRNPKYRARRMIIYGIVVITLLFLGNIFLRFFDFKHVKVSITLMGNTHYTEGQIYDVLGKNLANIITDSEGKTVNFLKDNLSYIKDAHISKNLVRRELTIEITERTPYARLIHIIDNSKQKKHHNNTSINKNSEFYLIDEAGYVLESISPETYNDLTSILDEDMQELVIGSQTVSETTQLGIRILKFIKTRKPRLAKDLRIIDPRIPQQIKIQLQSIPMPVLIASDLIETGLHHVDLFVKQQGLLILQKERQLSNMNKKTKTRKIMKTPLNEEYTYLDARYEDTLYIGGAYK